MDFISKFLIFCFKNQYDVCGCSLVKLKFDNIEFAGFFGRFWSSFFFRMLVDGTSEM